MSEDPPNSTKHQPEKSLHHDDAFTVWLLDGARLRGLAFSPNVYLFITEGLLRKSTQEAYSSTAYVLQTKCNKKCAYVEKVEMF